MRYGKIAFFTELERFQVKHDSPDDFRETPIVKATHRYLSKLKFTPILVQGINFNVKIIQAQKIPAIQKVFHESINGIKSYIPKGVEYLIDTKSMVKGDSQETILINCKYYVSSGVSVSINLKKIDDGLILNYNYEVEGLNKNREMVNNIKENYSHIYNYFETFLSVLEK